MIANFAVTYRCDSRCKNCYIWRMPAPDRGELSLGKIRDIFEVNEGFLYGVRSIQITGGEPFLRRDLLEVITAIHSSLPGAASGYRLTAYAPTLWARRPRISLRSSKDGGWGSASP